MSNVAFYSKALSASRILAHYDAGEFPVNTALPTISGTVKEGKALSAKAGSWSGVEPITFAYQWMRCNGVGGECVSIPSATAAKYTLADEDVGRTLRVAVSASNSAGAGSATSAQTVLVVGIKPSNTSLPAISGAAEDGQLLSASTGGWEGSTPFSYAYQWETVWEHWWALQRDLRGERGELSRARLAAGHDAARDRHGLKRGGRRERDLAATAVISRGRR